MNLAWRVLVFVGCWAIAFGIVEASVVIDLRGIMVGIHGGYDLSVGGISQFSQVVFADPTDINLLPPDLYLVEFLREAATIIMLASLALLAAKGAKERWAVFLWAFAIWDIVYYFALWAVIGWPGALADYDILFLIPVPWASRVWFPLLVSVLSIIAVLIAKLGWVGGSRLSTHNRHLNVVE